MNNKNFKIMLNEWKSFLSESNENVGIANIYKQIHMLEKINKDNTDLDFKIKIKKSSSEKYSIGYFSKEKSIRGHINDYLNSKIKNRPKSAPILYGCIDIISSREMLESDYDNPELEVPGKAVGEDNSTWYIRKTHQTKKGMGPLLYEVVIEFVSTHLNACIKPDPSKVSDAAISVWEKYLQRDDVISKQLDINPDDINYYKKEYPDQFEDVGHRKLKVLTPQTSDDTSQFSAMDHMGYMWPESPLSKAYRKNSANIIKLLKEKDLIIIDI
jgi:hypothetical protein